jgi:molecular chaperone GrpE (heat shock protein)
MSAPSEDGKTANGSDDRPAAARAAAEINAGSEVSRLRSRVSQLENELERKDAEIETVRRQYEAILQGGEYDVSTGGREGDAGLLDRLR